ncbi:MAG: hypothetical protein R3Y27_07555 [Clostridia bacterium]
MICLVSILSGVLLSIIPKSKMKSAFNMLCISILIYTIVFPLSSYDLTSLDFDSLLSINTELEQDYEEQNERLTIQTSETIIEETIKEQLSENKIEFDEVQVICVYEDENLVIDDINVIGDFTEQESEIISEIIITNIGDYS